MIRDSLDNAELYSSTHPLFEKAFKWIKENLDHPDGKIVIEEGKIIAIPQSYSTHPFSKDRFETHQKFIDIQFIVSGSEDIYIGNPSNMDIVTKYDEEKDISFLSGCGTKINVPQNFFLIIYPHEAHQPCVIDESHDNTFVKKIVVKIAV